MAATVPTPITPPPTAPSRASPATFAQRSDAWVAWHEDAVAEFDLVGADAYANAVDAQASATAASGSAAAALVFKDAAAASAAAAAASLNAPLWVSGTSYIISDVVRSPATTMPYICTAPTSGTTDPSADPSNWSPLVVMTEFVTAETFFLATF